MKDFVGTDAEKNSKNSKNAIESAGKNNPGISF